MDKYICIHGHFYQPPRENPWLEHIEVQDSAYPYNNWNERIAAECYAPNSAGRILQQNDRIVEILNNYSRISFNFGPTLLSWMEKNAPDLYEDILKADIESQRIFNGHGSAMAQAYNHIIMPLANSRDKRTQIIWGIRDFEYRFKRKPEGMWLPETAVDYESLDIMAEHDIKFTVLAPHQARRVRHMGSHEWFDVSGSRIDPQRAYLCSLPSGRKINIFFYDGMISQEVAFRGLLKSGDSFVNRLLNAFPEHLSENRLVSIATDGETYGHHHRYADMALAYCLHKIASNNLAKITIYPEFLEKFPPYYEVEIFEMSSWSCVHGIERWKANCGCSSGGNPSWQQNWRQPLREALNWLRDKAAETFNAEAGKYTKDPWQLRDIYIDVVLSRDEGNIENFFRKNVKERLSRDDKVKILKCLEFARHSMLMFTSCGWFFDEVSGIETTQIIQYAARVVQLIRDVSGKDLEGEFISRLKNAPSNLGKLGNAAGVYEQYVRPAMIDLKRVGAHYAISSLFEGFPKDAKVYCYSARSEVYDILEAGKQKMVIGRTSIVSDITWEEEIVCFSLLHLVEHIIDGGVSNSLDSANFRKMHREVKEAFTRSNLPEVIRLMRLYFGEAHYSLWHLFKHEQKKVLDRIMETTLFDIDRHFRTIYDQYYFLMQVRKDLNIPLPKSLATTAAFVLNRDLIELLGQEKPDTDSLQRTVDEIKRWDFAIDKQMVELVATNKLNDLMLMLSKSPGDLVLLESIVAILGILSGMEATLNYWRAQNIYFNIKKKIAQNWQEILQLNNTDPDWNKSFNRLGDILKVKVD
ncbi:MAG: DUF3536 domain-containing protein [Candidatus Omnitrophica bacterium]|nr:DUF3536 domain-containing protein [Candidatus Omnitrophota bacterium]